MCNSKQPRIVLNLSHNGRVKREASSFDLPMTRVERRAALAREPIALLRACRLPCVALACDAFVRLGFGGAFRRGRPRFLPVLVWMGLMH